MDFNMTAGLVRWLHIIAGIAWIGHLYFFNFVNLPFQGSIDDATKKAINAKLILRALWWFRWGAMVTFISGLVLFTMIHMYTPDSGFGPSAFFRMPEGGMSDRAVWIMWGMLFGTIMWFNVWFVIWPAQKSIFSGAVTPEQLPAVRARAALFSRINTYLSGPMLAGMVGGSHSDSFGFGDFSVVKLVLLTAFSCAAIWAAYFHAGKVGQSA